MGDQANNPYILLPANLPIGRISCKRCRAEIPNGDTCGSCNGNQSLSQSMQGKSKGIRPGRPTLSRRKLTVKLCNKCKHAITARQRTYEGGVCYPCHTGKERKPDKERNPKSAEPQLHPDLELNSQIQQGPAREHIRHTLNESLVVTLPVAEPVQQNSQPVNQPTFSGHDFPTFSGYDSSVPATTFQPEYQYPETHVYQMQQQQNNQNTNYYDNQYDNQFNQYGNQHYQCNNQYHQYEQGAQYQNSWPQNEYVQNQQPVNVWDTDYANCYNWPQ